MPTAAMSVARNNSMSGGNALSPKTGVTQYHAQLGVPDKYRAIKGLVVFNSWDLEPWDLLNGLALVCYQLYPEVWLVCSNLINLKIVKEA